MPETKTNRRQAAAKSSTVWSDEERAAMQESARERKRSAHRSPEEERAEGARECLAKIAEMAAADRSIAERIHAIITARAPTLAPRTWYGMPAYTRDGKVVCFFQAAAKFKARYATLGFNDPAKLDEGTMWPTAWALTDLTAADEARIGELVKRAAG